VLHRSRGGEARIAQVLGVSLIPLTCFSFAYYLRLLFTAFIKTRRKASLVFGFPSTNNDAEHHSANQDLPSFQ
jgi:hypothetical protein